MTPCSLRPLLKTCLCMSIAWLSTWNPFGLINASPLLAASKFAVTDLMLVAATSDEKALAYCEAQDNSKSWTTAGVTFTDVSAPSARLCIQRRPIKELANENEAAPVLTRLLVLENAIQCPKTMALLGNVTVSSRPAVICVSTSPAADSLVKQNYISDITITSVREYNNQFSGWTTLPANISMDLPFPSESNASAGAFISFQRQVVPIVELQVSTVDNLEEIPIGCDELQHDATSFWEQAGDGYIASVDGSEYHVLCLKRNALAVTTDAMILTDLSFSSDGKCTSLFPTAVAEPVSVCGKYEFPSHRRTKDKRFVGDVNLVRTKEAEDISQLLPGSWSSLLDDLSENDDEEAVYLFFRYTGEVELTPSEPMNKAPLVAKQKGSSLVFKIVQFADLHFAGDPEYACRDVPKGMDPAECKESVMTEFMNDVLDLEEPDMVVFSGDNVEAMSAETRHAAMRYATRPVEQRGIPWAMVFGNHDEESGFSREQMYKMAATMKNSYIQRGPLEVDGVGNYELTVMDPSEKRTALRMYFLDSHATADPEKHPGTSSYYDWVHQNQIDYYRVLSDSHRQDRVPALMFFHIPIPEYEAASQHALSGEKNERPSSPLVNTNLFSTLVEQEEVKAVFVGHDHLNEYCYKREGVQLCYGGGTGFGRAYGSDTFSRRVRVIEWSQDEKTGKRLIQSWKRRWDSIEEASNIEVLYEE